MTRLTFIFTFLVSQAVQGQQTLYHEYYESASDFVITKWNCDKNDLSNMYVIETIDRNNRVTELKFMHKGNLNNGSLCYLSTWLKYDYPNDTTIVLSYLNENGKPEANIECETPSATTYFLSSDGMTIKDSQSKYEFDPKPYYEIGWTKEFLENVIIELKANNKTTSPFIDYYSKSKSKFNGVFPVSNEFDIEKQYFNETEKKEIITVGNNVYDS